MLGHQGAQLADQVAGLAVFEIGGQSFLGRFQAQLLEPLDLGLREIVEPVVGERRSAPQGERLDELAAAHQRLEAVGVERRALDLQRVARGPPAHRQRLAEPRAQAGHLLLERLIAALGRLVAPDRLDQCVHRDGLGCP